MLHGIFGAVAKYNEKFLDTFFSIYTLFQESDGEKVKYNQSLLVK